MTNTQKAVVLKKQGEIAFEERPVPEIKDPHYVKVHIKKTGICGSDVHYYTHGAIGDFVVKEPMVLGHESSGVVVEVGEAVTLVKVGDRVAVEPGVPSRYSDETKSGHYNLCPHMEFAATPPIDGTLVKYYLIPEDFVVKLPDHVSLEEGACIEPLSVGVHANRLAGTGFGKKVVIFGAGPVGLVTGNVASAFGASDVVYVDVFEHKLKRAKEFGGTQIINSKDYPKEDDLVKAIQDKLGGKSPEIAIDCSGAEVCIRSAIKVLKVGGTFVQVGMGRDDVNFPITLIITKELRVLGSFRYYFDDYNIAVKLVSEGKVNAKALITHTFKFDEAIDAYNFNRDHGNEVVKTIIDGPE
ncbi:xylitol dehydrogenase [Kluyveromyces marxianus]|uniref:Xylitol dehydrogenase n=1 Tax=Kluyveromyces marxianus TaxID=4911 RepID=H6S169_KLUMA|nr:xylitol dehydrogenase [Kluyveromyces marxianus]BAP73320.1 xylitol dehydrogenase [Kluyveromyces marxianus]